MLVNTLKLSLRGETSNKDWISTICLKFTEYYDSGDKLLDY